MEFDNELYVCVVSVIDVCGGVLMQCLMGRPDSSFQNDASVV